MGSRHLGTASVRGRKRLPLPAAKRKAFFMGSAGPLQRNLGACTPKGPLRGTILILINERIVDQYARTVEIESKTHLLYSLGGEGLSHSGLIFLVTVEEHETTTTCA